MRRPSASIIVVLLVMTVDIVISVQGLWSPNSEEMARKVVRSDVKGYYGYLQALFIRKDLGHEPYQWEYVRRTPTGTLNKYFCGTALMMAPWFAIGHNLAQADPKAPRDGLSIHEMRALSIGAWFYLFVGLMASRLLLLRCGMRDAVVAWTLLAFGLGTQLMQYSAMQPGWSHVYSFCCVALFLLAVRNLANGASAWWCAAAAALFALIVLIRPVNALVILAVPIVAGSALVPLLHRMLRQPFALISAVLLGLAILCIQPFLWHAQIGKWFAYGYTGEGFHWDRPEVFKVLFGFRRGLFLWAPVLLLALFGTVHSLWRDRGRGLWLLAYWAVNVYVISAWWIWYYGSGFGSRVFVDHYPVLMLPCAWLLNALGPRWWLAARGYIILCCAYLLFQMWQYHAFILHHESMDQAKYVHTFLRYGDRYRGALAGNYQSPPYNPRGMDVVIEESCDFEHACAHWGGAAIRHTHIAFSGANAAHFSGQDEFGLGFTAPAGTLPAGRALYLEVGLQRLELAPGTSHDLMAVTDVKHADGSQAYYEPFHIDPLPATMGRWEQLEYRIPVPALEPGDRLAFYFWDQNRSARVLIDDVFMRVSAVRPY